MESLGSPSGGGVNESKKWLFFIRNYLFCFNENAGTTFFKIGKKSILVI